MLALQLNLYKPFMFYAQVTMLLNYEYRKNHEKAATSYARKSYTVNEIKRTC